MVGAMSTQEEITIAKMVLAGWRFEPISINVGTGARNYRVVSPNGRSIGMRSTRYTAALMAERYMEEYCVGPSA